MLPWDDHRIASVDEGGWTPVSASALPYHGMLEPHALTVAEIKELVAAFAAAAVRAVNAGFDVAEGEALTEVEKTVNRLQQELRGPWENVRLDPFTHAYALETLKKHHPKVAYFAYGETDDWAHEGAYDQYLWSARQSDAYIQEIWDYLQSDPFYKDKTTLLVTVDHGRGTGKENWKNHGASVEGSGQVWLMVMGPDTPALGEIKEEGQWYTAMLARSIFHLLGLDYPDPKAAPRLKSISTH
ncbi:MAG: hypothetical protein EB038_05000 [Cyclobacteriaceae bacterium]|nr:hypothetical protein [Cyclobacteriaceae bacterium]